MYKERQWTAVGLPCNASYNRYKTPSWVSRISEVLRDILCTLQPFPLPVPKKAIRDTAFTQGKTPHPRRMRPELCGHTRTHMPQNFLYRPSPLCRALTQRWTRLSRCRSSGGSASSTRALYQTQEVLYTGGHERFPVFDACSRVRALVCCVVWVTLSWAMDCEKSGRPPADSPRTILPTFL